MIYPKMLTPNRLIHHILDHQNNPLGSSKDYTYIITGNSGPTGKTWLCTGLRLNGFNAIEISEDICALVEYKDCHNHFIVNEQDKYVLIVLNHRFEEVVEL